MFEREMQCQVCGFKPCPSSIYNEPEQEWVVHTVNFQDGASLQILTCEDCNPMTTEQAFEYYKRRILAGGDLNYH